MTKKLEDHAGERNHFTAKEAFAYLAATMHTEACKIAKDRVYRITGGGYRRVPINQVIKIKREVLAAFKQADAGLSLLP